MKSSSPRTAGSAENKDDPGKLLQAFVKFLNFPEIYSAALKRLLQLLIRQYSS